MYFSLKVDKTIQAIGVLFCADNVLCMNYMRVLKLLYIADREALRETGRPITGGRITAMERGPVLEDVYDLIRGQHLEMPLWDEHFEKDRYDLKFALHYRFPKASQPICGSRLSRQAGDPAATDPHNARDWRPGRQDVQCNATAPEDGGS